MDFIQEINKEGQIYLVGGAVRDRLFYEIHKIGTEPKDFDLMVSKIPDSKLFHILSKHGKVKEIGKAFGIITFKPTDKRILRDIEIALPRTEVSTGPGYRDFKIVADSFIDIEQDLSRRDATINSIAVPINSVDDLYKNIKIDEIIDPFNGVDDIKEMLWRAVGDPQKRFLEDPTRMMRCIRQSSVFGLRVEKKTLHAIIDNSDLLKIVVDDSPVRLTEELARGIRGKYFINWIEFVLSNRIGEIMGLKYDESTIKKIYNQLKYAYNNNMSYIVIMFLILFPLGKRIDEWTKLFELSAAPHFRKNDTYLLRRIGLFINQLIEINKNIDINTDEFNEIILRKWIQKTDDSLKNILYDKPISEYVFNVLECIEINNCEKLKKLYKEIQHIVIIKMNDLELSGNYIQDFFQVSGKKIGTIKEFIFNKVIEGKLENDNKIIINYLTLFKNELIELLDITH